MSETVLDFTERNPDPSDWVRGERTDEAQRMRDVLTADMSARYRLRTWLQL